MATIQRLDSTLSFSVPRSPTYHCIVPSRTSSPATMKAPSAEEDEEEGDGRRCLDVYDPESRMRYACPKQLVSHKGCGDKLVVCKVYSGAIAEGKAPNKACPMGNKCRFAHIDVPLNQLKGDIIHVHYIYREPSLCMYERLSTAMAREQPQLNTDNLTLQLPCPSGDDHGTITVPISQILVTEGAREALKAKRTQPCHCAHYYYAQTCNRGASCSFIHVVSVDPSQERDSTRPSTFRKRMRQLGLELPIDSFRINASPISSVLKGSKCTSPSTFSIRSMSTTQDRDIGSCDAESMDDCFHYPYARQGSCVSVGLSASFKSLPVPKSTSPCALSFLPKENEDSFITIRTNSSVLVPLEAAQPAVPKGRFVHNPYQGSCMAVEEAF